MSTLVVVESPTKARTIRAYLSDDHVVLASMGHVRDLPSSASEIPAAARAAPWSRLGVDVDGGFQALYVVPAKRRATIKELKQALKDADELVIATDEDREGESIGWHLVEVLRPKVPVRRMVFHEITRTAIQRALASPRQIDDHLVRAQETRRILDRLVGYTLSPLLWKKIAPRLSAGRVQSVAVRLLVERERERHAFVRGAYWDLLASLGTDGAEAGRFTAALAAVAGRRVAGGRDFDEATGRLYEGSDVLLLDEPAAAALRDRLLDEPWVVAELEAKTSVRRPYPPFTTSSLQQEAGRKLRMGARETMRVAQELYEQGFITYHRTDSVQLAEEAIEGIRRRVASQYSAEYLSPKARRFRTASRSAQEAHEAVRPAGTEMRPLSELTLTGDRARLYDLIWKRTMATQMADARLELVTAEIDAADARFVARGRRVLFPGFFRAYVEGSDDPEAAIEDRDEPLPALERGQSLRLHDLQAVGHETRPPGRYTEAALVKALEAAGVGRPSTYATIIGTIQDRGYVRKADGALVPTFVALAVTDLLASDFQELVDLGFTAAMEQDLDLIAQGQVDWQAYLDRFFHGERGLAHLVEAAEATVDPRVASTVRLGSVEVRIGRYGPFLEQRRNGDRITSSIPEDLAPGDLTPELAARLLEQGAAGPECLGVDDASGLPVFVRQGPFGPYAQLGDAGAEKPKRVSLPPGLEPEDVDLPTALALLDLPRELGLHPDSGKPVRAGIGRFGPYVVHDGTFASLRKDDDVLAVDLERALELLQAKAARGARGGGRRQSAAVLRELGAHPASGQPVEVLDGRYGPYVRHGKTNASLPKDVKVGEISLEAALALLAEKEARKPAGRKRRA